jgi:class 3 adenylate cyclase
MDPEEARMDTNQALGARIRDRRQRLHLSQSSLAGALGVSPQAVSKWERGENGPDLSLLVPLSRALGVSTDWLLGHTSSERETFEATVFVSAVPGYTRRSERLGPRELLAWINGILYQVTEAVRGCDGVPVKYMGDGFLAFFAGFDHAGRALRAARSAVRIVSEPLRVALNTGPIHLGACGHPEYACTDILGAAVNVCFRVLQWSGGRDAAVAATAATVGLLAGAEGVGPAQPTVLKGIEAPVDLHVIDPV